MFFSSCSSNFLRKSEISYIAKLTRLSLKQQILFRVGHTIILLASKYLVPNHRLVLEVLKRCVASTCSKKLDEVILDRSLCDSSIHNTHFSDCWYNTNIRGGIFYLLI